MPRANRPQPTMDTASEAAQRLGPMAPSLANLAASLRAKAAELRGFEAVQQAVGIEWAALQVELALRAAAEEVLTLEQAAKESGYSAETLRHKLADGEIPNAGRKHAPRIRRGDLPRRVASSQSSAYNPADDALSIARKQRAS